MSKKDNSDCQYEIIDEPQDKKSAIVAIGTTVLLFGFIAILLFILCGCSVTLQNVNIDDVNASGHLDSIFPPTNSVFESEHASG